MASAPVPAASRAGANTRLVLIVSGTALAVVAIVAVVALHPWTSTAGDGTAADGTATTAAAGPPAGVPATSADTATVVDQTPATATASAVCVSAPSKDAGGNPTSYDADNAIDDRPDTAWRCDGDGVGQQLRLDFSRPVTLTDVGIIPGLAKTDPYDGADRYRQCRRISAVRLIFDSGDSVTANLDTSPDNRAVQHIALTPVTTRSLIVTVVSSVEGSPVGELPPTDKVAISTLTWSAT